MVRGLVTPILTLVLAAGGCTWPRDNPDDPWRCDPACGAGQRCQAGRCVGADARVTDGWSGDARRDARPDDIELRDQPQPDKPIPPDGPWPDAPQTGCKSNADCTSSSACAVGTCNTSTGSCSYAPAAKEVLCRKQSGLCDVAEVCNGTSTACPKNSYKLNGVVCRTASGTCNLAEACLGTSPACPPNALKAKGTTCRASSGVCNPAEACTGSSAHCPPDVGSTVQNVTYKTSWGSAGSTRYDGTSYGVNYSNVKAGCAADSAGVVTHYRGWVRFKTATFSASKVLTAYLRACNGRVMGGATGTLYVANFKNPLISTNHVNAAGAQVVVLPKATGLQTFAIPTSQVKIGQDTMFTARANESACNSSPGGRLVEWATDQKGFGAACPNATPWELLLSYCK